MTETHELQPLASTWLPSALPGPQALKRYLREQLERHIIEARRERGPTHAREDHYDLIGTLAETAELMDDFAEVFKGIAKESRQECEVELLDAVGVQARADGGTGYVPMENLTVPRHGGDIKLERDFDRKNTADESTLRAVAVSVAASVARMPETMSGHDDEDMQSYGAQVADLATSLLLRMGKFEGQVSKVKALAAELARDGDPKTASVLTGALHKTETYKGVKVSRK